MVDESQKELLEAVFARVPLGLVAKAVKDLCDKNGLPETAPQLIDFAAFFYLAGFRDAVDAAPVRRYSRGSNGRLRAEHEQASDEEVSTAFHKIWSSQVGQVGYDKRQWQELESFLHSRGVIV